MKSLQYCELVLKRCSRTYGSSPCTAAVGVTGDYKCYNSPRTCQDPSNYDGSEEQVIRWAVATGDLPLDINADPRITSMSLRPQMIDPGESIGVRESGSITLSDSLHNDVGFDKYIADRGYNTYNKGTYWSKFFARWGNIQGNEFRTIHGEAGQELSEMETRYYIVEDSNGPDAKGNYSIEFKDILKLCDDEKAQAPEPSPGTLAADISASAGGLTLAPTGIGDLYYPGSGLASIGDEVVSFVRTGDAITLVSRGLRNSKQDEHEEGETFQLALVFSAESPSDIINSLLTYTKVPASYYDLTEWTAEMDNYIGRLYSGDIMKPTPVKKLLNDLVREVGLIFYSDLRAKKIAVKALRQFIPTYSIDDNVILAGSLASKPLYNKRVSQVWTYYGKRNPLEAENKKENYRSIYASVTQNEVVALESPPEAIKEVYSRWITTDNQPAAQALNELILARYETAPRQISLKLPVTIAPREGQVIYVKSRIFVDSQGDPIADPIVCQVLQVERDPDHYKVLLEEALFNQIPVGTERIINISDNIYNANIKTLHDSIYTPISSGMTVKVYVANGVHIGSISTSTAALNLGSWPAGVTIEIYFGTSCRVQGAGGNGGYSNISAGGAGGLALLVGYNVTIYGDVEIWGGGGGGGGLLINPPPPAVQQNLYGGGGAGDIPGTPGGTTELGSTAQPVPGGNPGVAGGSGTTAGGAAGYAINGVSFITFVDTPDIQGPTS